MASSFHQKFQNWMDGGVVGPAEGPQLPRDRFLAVVATM
jgi:hypothetical protein